MGISKYTPYKYVKVNGTWRYCKAAYHDNGLIAGNHQTKCLKVSSCKAKVPLLITTRDKFRVCASANRK